MPFKIRMYGQLNVCLSKQSLAWIPLSIKICLSGSILRLLIFMFYCRGGPVFIKLSSKSSTVGGLKQFSEIFPDVLFLYKGDRCSVPPVSHTKHTSISSMNHEGRFAHKKSNGVKEILIKGCSYFSLWKRLLLSCLMFFIFLKLVQKPQFLRWNILDKRLSNTFR